MAAMARLREWQRDNEPSLGADACAWMAFLNFLLNFKVVFLNGCGAGTKAR